MHHMHICTGYTAYNPINKMADITEHAAVDDIMEQVGFNDIFLDDAKEQAQSSIA